MSRIQEDVYTNRKVISLVREEIGDAGSKLASTNWLSSSFVFEVLLAVRAKLIRNKIENNIELSKFLEQTIACMPLEKVDRDECPCTPAEGCVFLRTVDPLPVLIKLTSVTSATGCTDYEPLQWNNYKVKLSSRREANRKKPYYSTKNVEECPMLYLYGDPMKKNASVTGIWYNPLQVQKFNPCEDKIGPKCKSNLDYKFIFDPDSMMDMVELAARYIKLYKQGVKSDVLGNNNDEVQNPLTRLT